MWCLVWRIYELTQTPCKLNALLTWKKFIHNKVNYLIYFLIKCNWYSHVMFVVTIHVLWLYNFISEFWIVDKITKTLKLMSSFLRMTNTLMVLKLWNKRILSSKRRFKNKECQLKWFYDWRSNNKSLQQKTFKKIDTYNESWLYLWYFDTFRINYVFMIYINEFLFLIWIYKLLSKILYDKSQWNITVDHNIKCFMTYEAGMISI